MLVSVPLSYRFSGIHVAKVQRNMERTKKISLFLFFDRKILLGFRFSTQRRRDAE